MSLVNTRRKMKQVSGAIALSAFVAIFIIGIFMSFNFNGPGGAGGAQERLFATINGERVTSQDFNQILQQMRQFMAMGRPVSAQQQSMLAGQAYQQLLQEYAEAAAARAYGIQVSPEEARREAEKQIDEQLKNVAKGATPEELAQYRASMLNGLDIDSEQRRLAAQRLSEKLTQTARPTEVKVAHVLVKTENRTPEQALQLAQDIARRARAGEDFSKLAKQHSEDVGSKEKGGEVGWAGAIEATPDPKKPNPEAVSNFVPEFTAAALMLKPGEISDPVRSTFGYHVLKALQERPYEPTDKESAKDPKKRQEAVDAYKRDWANKVRQGLASDYQARMQVTPESPWLKGFLAEQQVNPGPPPSPSAADQNDKSASLEKAQQLSSLIASYAQAVKSNDPASGPGLSYKMGQLYNWAGQWYERAGEQARATAQYQEGKEFLDRQASRYRDGELYLQLGEIQEKLKDKTAALDAYKRAMERARGDVTILTQLTEKFKALGHPELVQEAAAKQAEGLKRQAAERKAQEEAFRKMMEQNKPSAGAPAGEGRVLDTVTVKPGGDKKDAGAPPANGPAANAPAANVPAANAPAGNAP